MTGDEYGYAAFALADLRVDRVMTADAALEAAAVAFVMETWRDEEVTEAWAREWVREHGESAKRRCRAAIVAYALARADRRSPDSFMTCVLDGLADELAPAPAETTGE